MTVSPTTPTAPAHAHARPVPDLFDGGPFSELARWVLERPEDAAIGGLWGSAGAYFVAAVAQESAVGSPQSAVGSRQSTVDSRQSAVGLPRPLPRPAPDSGLRTEDSSADGPRLLVIASGAAAAEALAADLRAFGLRPLLLPPPGAEPLVRAERLRALGTLASESPPDVVVASPSAALAPVPDRGAIFRDRLGLAAGRPLSPRALAEMLVDRGYERVPLVDAPGQFALRGSLVDVYPLGADLPCRAEFEGDRIESLRRFDPGDQASREPVERLLILGHGGPIERGSLLDYLPPAARVAWRDPLDLDQRLARGAAADPEAAETRDRLAAFRRLASAWPALRLETLPVPEGPRARNARVRSLQRFSTSLTDLPREIRAAGASADRLVVFCDTPAEEERLRDLLREAGGVPAGLETLPGRLEAGFACGAWTFVSHAEIFHRHRVRRGPEGSRMTAELRDVMDLQPGDAVVHVLHGIGRFLGMKRIAREGRAQEYLLIEYAGNAQLQVPASQMDLVQKYLGGTDAAPPLSRLGTRAWAEKKLQAQASIEKLARDLLGVQALREQFTGTAFPSDTPWQASFEASFPYEDTPDQVAATAEIKRDMESPYPTDRLICGDVGYGKTELAMRAAFKAAVSGKQTAVLVPTTVLAEQHGVTFHERMAAYPIRIAVLSRFRSPREQREILERAASGDIDILIGTHRLVQGDVRFRDLGLVVIDEEQRFGVEHKERLKRLRATVDVLTLTATPIPRTLHMALLGLRDISNLVTPPQDRLAVRTEVCADDPAVIREAIRRELDRDGQVFFVHNRIYDIEDVARRVREIVPLARVAVVHGQLPEEALEEHMTAFLNREIDVLVTTTIIESGVDIPNANTIFVHDADQYGLADLHQLRGRVGRYRHQAYAYILLPRDRPVTPEARRRLKAIEEFSELGAGFKIALRDLEIRGVGNLLGREQHGHIAAIGYDLYCRMLERTVKGVRKEAAPPALETVVEFDVDAEIPEGYVLDERLRLDLYRRGCRCRTREELEALRREFRDRFGPLPAALERFLRLIAVRIAAEAHGIASLLAGPDGVAARYRSREALEALKKRYPGMVRIVDDETARLALAPDPKDPEWQLHATLEMLTAASNRHDARHAKAAKE